MSNQNNNDGKKITITISKEQLQLLSEKFPENTEKEIVETAVEEFFDFLDNPKQFSKYSSFLEYRLYLIIKNIFKDSFISESAVRKIFKIDSSPATRMINNVKIDYEKELNTYNKQSMKNFLSKINQEEENGKYSFTCSSSSLIDSLNQLLQEINDNARKIFKEKGTLCTYNIFIDEYELLIEELSK